MSIRGQLFFLAMLLIMNRESVFCFVNKLTSSCLLSFFLSSFFFLPLSQSVTKLIIPLAYYRLPSIQMNRIWPRLRNIPVYRFRSTRTTRKDQPQRFILLAPRLLLLLSLVSPGTMIDSNRLKIY